MNDEVSEVYHSTVSLEGATGEVDGIEYVSSSDVEEAARAVVTAAAEARSREFQADPSSGFPTEDAYNEAAGDYNDSMLLDSATGEYWVLDGGSYINTTTQETIDRNPMLEPDETAYEWVTDEFVYFYERSTLYPSSMAGYCEEAREVIKSSGYMSSLEDVKDAVADWGGESRNAFVTYFLNPFASNTVANHEDLLSELALAMYAYEAILKQARVDAKQIADEAVDVLDSMNAHSGGFGEALLAVVGIAAAVVGAVSGGGAVAVTAGLIGAGVQTVEEAADNNPSISGGTVDEVMDQLKNVLEELREAMDSEEEQLAVAIDNTTNEVRALMSGDSDKEKDSDKVKSSILPHEPNGDGVTNVTSGKTPSKDEFWSDWS